MGRRDATLKMNKRRGGTSLVELVMVMMMLALFGVTIYTLISAGANAQARIIGQKDAQADARVALSFINVKLRQNDSADKISVEPIALTGKNAILIRERTDMYSFDTWIYCHEGRLYEFIAEPGELPLEFGLPILDIEGLEVEFDESSGTVTNTVYYYYDGAVKSMTSSVFLRSAG
ncbi:MAG: DUF4860 domain-containing protein [Defluviitaleaceae bacterium]|nr:DUF4860 domain-containing protein [Defluviitaleaceae bacterium]